MLDAVSTMSEVTNDVRVIILPAGPYLVKGNIPINKLRVVIDAAGIPVGYEIVEEYPVKPVQSLCRCGKSQTLPFCDGAHRNHGFEGKETAERVLFREKARVLVGRNLTLLDYRELCMGVGFCHRAGSTWVLTRLSDDPEKRKLAIETAQLCPSGRLVACDKETETPIEPNFEPSISIIEDPRFKGNCPIWLKGGIPVESADGDIFEVRNRVTLCSCGKSRMMPFCDGRHYFA